MPAAGSRQGKPPEAKCYSSLLAFEVTASWAAEAAACGLWLVGLLKIWSLTFQVRMSHRHWSHNCSCEITQACWEERTSEQTCGLDSVSDNTTVCVFVHVPLVHVVFPHPPADAALQPLAEILLLPLFFHFQIDAFIMKHVHIFLSLYTCQVLVRQNIFILIFILKVFSPDKLAKCIYWTQWKINTSIYIELCCCKEQSLTNSWLRFRD